MPKRVLQGEVVSNKQAKTVARQKRTPKAALKTAAKS